MTGTYPDFVYLSQEDVRQTGVDMAAFVTMMEKHFRLHAENHVVLPPKTVLDLGERQRGRINALSAYVGGEIDACGIKWVASFPGNPAKHNAPRANALIILNDSHTGAPLAVMDGTYISAMRTGAVSGVGAKYLAPPEVTTLALIGCGVQARTQLRAIITVLPQITKVRCYDVRPQAAQAFSRVVRAEDGVSAEAAASPEAAVRGADIIVTVTVADEPIVKYAWLIEGSLMIHVGSYQEEEEDVVLNADKIVVDDWESVHHRRTPILATMYDQGKLSRDDIYANLGEIVSGQKTGRKDRRERIFLLPIGMGSEDVIAAFQIYQRAREMGLGRELSLWSKFAFEG